MKNKAVKIGVIASILPHLFCCVLPVLLSLIGLFAPEISHKLLIPEWLEPWIFVFSAIMLILSWILVLRDCPCCLECGENNSHKKQKIILMIISVLFVISIVLHLLSHY